MDDLLLSRTQHVVLRFNFVVDHKVRQSRQILGTARVGRRVELVFVHEQVVDLLQVGLDLLGLDVLRFGIKLDAGRFVFSRGLHYN